MSLFSVAFRRLLRSSTTSPSSSVAQWRWASSSSSLKLFPFDVEEKELPPLTTNKLFISGLSRLTTDDKLKEAFTPYGQLLEAKVITDKVSGRSKGFGFVQYATIEEADKARYGMNAKFLDGWVIFVDPAKPREPKPPTSVQSEPLEDGVRTNKTVGWSG